MRNFNAEVEDEIERVGSMLERQMEREAQRYESTIAGLRSILADREKELLDVKGPCSCDRCRLHYAHSGPCDIRTPRPAKETTSA